jgi:hypothetical protein
MGSLCAWLFFIFANFASLAQKKKKEKENNLLVNS